MAMQTGIGFSRLIIYIGAGYTGTILFKNGKLSDFLEELESILKGKQGNSSNGDADVSDAIAEQVRRLAREVRELASGRQITIFNGNSGQIGNITSLIVPTAVLGTLGYGYMWWKGLSFSDLMYVTKHNMASAVTNLTKHLEHVSEALAATKRHLTQRIENLDGKLDQQLGILKYIKNEVGEVRGDLSNVGLDVNQLQRMLAGLDVKLMSLEDKQDITNMGLLALCNFADGKKTNYPELMDWQEKLKLAGKSHGYILPPNELTKKGLKGIADSLDISMKDNLDIVAAPRTLLRRASTKC